MSIIKFLESLPKLAINVCGMYKLNQNLVKSLFLWKGNLKDKKYKES